MARRPFSTLMRALDTDPERRSPPDVPDPDQATNNRDRLGRSLAASPSRRGAVCLAAKTALALLVSWHLPGEAEAHNALKKCDQIKRKSAQKRCTERARNHNAKHKNKNRTPPMPKPRMPNASCTVELNRWSDFTTDIRAAQTFTEPNGGKLTAAGLLFSRGTALSGTFLLTVNAVDATTGIPTNQVFASATVPVTGVSTEPEMVTFNFANPARVVAGRQYALVLSRTGPGCCHQVHGQRPATCPGGAFYVSATMSGTFFEPFTGEATDVSYTTTVSP